MAKSVNHYTKQGKLHRGGTHKMPNGDTHTGAKHTANSKKLFHFGELSKSAQTAARKSRAKQR
tara:strand:+ start:4360 stop:4548 length:189 start_codon:yes stop_codon:yes gene_type:complete